PTLPKPRTARLYVFILHPSLFAVPGSDSSYMAFQPGYHTSFQVAQMAFLSGAVTLARIDDQLGRHVALPKGSVERVRLVDRNAFIFFAMKNQRRRRHASGVGDGRTLAIGFGVIQNISVNEAPVPIGNVCLGVEAMEVTDACTHDRCFET